ncbi:MAG: hypothetical protein WAO69_09395 [Aestuariivita sp.]|uniref:hypothetical protein n=1 Tax=Aestuariivita sp. TaxID=1872407 RepID=UPI003BB082B5
MYSTHDRSDFEWYLASIGFGRNPAAMRRAYRAEHLKLFALSDEDLLAKGLRRPMIAEHVFFKLMK